MKLKHFKNEIKCINSIKKSKRTSFFYKASVCQKMFSKNLTWRNIFFSLFFSFMYTVSWFMGSKMYFLSQETNSFSLFQSVLFYIFVFVLAFSFYFLISLFVKKTKLCIQQKRVDKRRNIFFPFLVFFLILFASWCIAWLAFWPGVFSYDLPNDFHSVNMGIISTTRPPAQVLLWCFFYNISHFFGIEPIILFTLFQLLFLAFCFAVILLNVYMMFNNKLPAFLFLFYLTLNPVVSCFSVTTALEVPFSGFFGLTLLYLFKTLFCLDFSSRRKSFIFFLIFAFLSSLFRNNFIYAYFVFSCILFILYVKRRKTEAIALFLPILLFFLCSSLGCFLGFAKDSKWNTFGLPLQQMAYVLKTQQAKLTEQDYLDLEQLGIKSELVADKYNLRIVDPIKLSLMQEDTSNIDSILILKEWLKLGCRFPKEYLYSFLQLYLPFWYQDTTYPDSISHVPYIECNIVDLETIYGKGYEDSYSFTRNNFLPRLNSFFENVASYKKFANFPWLLRIPFLLSTPFWLFIICFLVSVQRHEKKKTIFFSFSLLLLATYFLGPVANFRYIYPFLIIYPFYLSILFMKERD